MYKDEFATSYGRECDSARVVFSAGKVGIHFGLSAGIRGAINNSKI